MDDTERRWLASRVRDHEAARAAAAANDDDHWERQHRREKRRYLNALQNMHGWHSNVIAAKDET
jgi:hypothetical protein